MIAVQGINALPPAAEPTLRTATDSRSEILMTPWGLGLRCDNQSWFQEFGETSFAYGNQSIPLPKDFPTVYTTTWEEAAASKTTSFADMADDIASRSQLHRISNLTEEQKQYEEAFSAYLTEGRAWASPLLEQLKTARARLAFWIGTTAATVVLVGIGLVAMLIAMGTDPGSGAALAAASCHFGT